MAEVLQRDFDNEWKKLNLAGRVEDLIFLSYSEVGVEERTWSKVQRYYVQMVDNTRYNFTQGHIIQQRLNQIKYEKDSFEEYKNLSFIHFFVILIVAIILLSICILLAIWFL